MIDRDRFHPILPLLMATACAVLVVAAFYPGYVSFDSAYQYWQLRNDQLTTLHPPLMAFVWMLTDRLIPGPGGLFTLQLLTYYGGVLGLALQLGSRTRAIAAIVLLGLSPPLLLLLAHVWKDVLLLGFAALGTAFALLAYRRAQVLPAIAATAALLIASALRHNAALAMLPLLALAWWSVAGSWRARLLTVAISLVLVIALQASLSRLPSVEQQRVWPSVALWDLAHLSVQRDQLLLPAFTVGHGMTPQELSEAISPWSNVSLFSATSSGVNNGLHTAYTPAQARQLRDQWLGSMARFPGDYFDHRTRLFAELIHLSNHTTDPDFDYTPTIVAFRDNPKFEPNQSRLNTWLLSGLERLRNGPLFFGWVYLLLLLAALMPWGRYRSNTASVMVASSGLLYCLPLLLIAPSVEFRYLIWAIFTAPLALLLRGDRLVPKLDN